jgi:hypothetical protein
VSRCRTARRPPWSSAWSTATPSCCAAAGVGPLGAEPTRVRVLLVDTPEVHGEQECFGAEASARAAELLPDGAQVRVEADRDPQDRYDRALLHVWTEDGVNVGEQLVREGLAEVLWWSRTTGTSRPSTPRRSRRGPAPRPLGGLPLTRARAAPPAATGPAPGPSRARRGRWPAGW